MGTDIHMVVQVFAGVPGAWVNVPPPPEMKFGATDKWWVDRNYALFHVLAGVRTHSWGDDAPPPISEARGKKVGLDIDYDRLGDHNHSWLTLDEMQSYKHWDELSKEFGPSSLDLLKALGALAARVKVEPRCIRIIFGFDC